MRNLPSTPDRTPPRTAALLIAVDESGVSIGGYVNTEVYETPAPLSTDAALAYLHLLLVERPLRERQS